MPQKYFQGMQFSEASGLWRVIHGFDHIKNYQQGTHVMSQSASFVECLLYPRPHPKCWGYSKVAALLALNYGKTEMQHIFPLAASDLTSFFSAVI